MQSKPVIIGLDSSGSPLLIVAAKGSQKAVRRRSGIKQERILFPALQHALAAVGGSLQEVGTIFIVRGPGRFTGIRISLTFASMMQYLNQAKVRSATVFEILRYQVEKSLAFKRWKKQNPSGALGVVLHAFRKEYFLQIFDEQNRPPAWMSLEELQVELSAYPHPLFLAGTGANKAPLHSILTGNFAWARPVDCVVQPATLLALAQQDCWEENALEPLYLKPARFELVEPK